MKELNKAWGKVEKGRYYLCLPESILSGKKINFKQVEFVRPLTVTVN